MASSTRGPWLTLASVVVLAAVLLGANNLVGNATPAASTAPAPTGPAATTPATEAAPSPSAPSTTAPASVQAVYTGRTSGGEATVAVAVDDDQAAAYLCDGESLEAWLQGSVGGDQVRLTGRDQANLTASISGSTLLGTVTTNTGQTMPFSASEAVPPAGIYESRTTIDGLATRIGWVVLPDGTQVGIARVGDDRRSAPEFDPADGSFTLDGTSGTAAPISGSDTVVGG